MVERAPLESEAALRAEVVRLNKVVAALVQRAERTVSGQRSEFDRFQHTVLLENQVRARTHELEVALQENQRITRALRESEARFRGVASQPLIGVAISNGRRLVYTNEKFASMFGHADEALAQMDFADIVAPEDRHRFSQLVQRGLTGEVDRLDAVVRGLCRDGRCIDLQLFGAVVDGPDAPMLIGFVLDITERLRAEQAVRQLNERLREQSIRDPLTGLYNRRFFEDALQRELALAERSGGPVSLVLTDLDHFKRVNDGYGHPAGDAVLRAFATLLSRHTRRSDICCRYGGEEFIVLLPGLDEAGAAVRAEQWRALLAAEPLRVGADAIACTASFGVAALTPETRDPAALVAAADRALYAAKDAGRNQVVRCSLGTVVR